MARAKEYAFLLYSVLLAAAYGVAHDQVTVTISPEYFIYGKGLDEHSLRAAVTLLAVRVVRDENGRTSEQSHRQTGTQMAFAGRAGRPVLGPRLTQAAVPLAPIGRRGCPRH